MILNDSAITDIKRIKDFYEEKNIIGDKLFIRDVFDILKHQSTFFWTMQYDFVEENIPGSINMVNRSIQINYDKFIKKCERLANTWKEYYSIQDITPIVNIFIIYGLLHESAHLWQVCGMDKNKEVNRFYEHLYKKLDNLSLLLWYRYTRNPEQVSFERHANVDAYREVAKIYSDTKYHDIPEASHMYSLSYLKNNSSPVLRTMKDALIKNDYDFSSLSIEETLEFGAPLEKEILLQFDDVLIKYSREAIDYSEAQEQIKKLRR